jgi:hypothetical protein
MVVLRMIHGTTGQVRATTKHEPQSPTQTFQTLLLQVTTVYQHCQTWLVSIPIMIQKVVYLYFETQTVFVSPDFMRMCLDVDVFLGYSPMFPISISIPTGVNE